MNAQIEGPKTRADRRFSQADHTHTGEATVATVWLALYVLFIGAAVILPMFSHGIEVAAR